MDIKQPKPSEVMQAQVAGFAEHERDASRTEHDFIRGLERGARADKLYASIGSIGMTTTLNEVSDAVLRSDYASYLRERSDEERGATQKEAGILAAFDNFVPAIDRLQSDIEKDKVSSLGGGVHSMVYPIEVNDKKYVVRMVNPNSKSVVVGSIIHDHVAAGARATGIPGMEKITAASYAKNMVVSEFIDAKKISNLSPTEILQIPDEHLDKLRATREQASARGIKFDAHYDNLLYDPESGFTDIDYGIAGAAFDKVEAMASIISSLELTEHELYEDDPMRRAQNEQQKVAVWQRLNTYIRANFNSWDQEY
jgi:hypothetical protein